MTVVQPSVADTVRRLVITQLDITGPEPRPDEDLRRWGMTSLTCLGLMLSIEDTFEIELPEDALRQATFRSIDSISAAVESSREQATRIAGEQRKR